MEDNFSPWTGAVGLRGWGGKQDGSSGNASDGEAMERGRGSFDQLTHHSPAVVGFLTGYGLVCREGWGPLA